MVYNALKMFMEINLELFEEAMQQFKRDRILCVYFLVSYLSSPMMQGGSKTTEAV